MAITFPRTDIITADQVDDQIFDLIERQQLSRTGDGVTRGKSFGSAIWRVQTMSVILENDEALELVARLRSLDGVVRRFYLGELLRPYPKAHSDGAFTDDGTIHSVNVNNHAMRIANLDVGFTLSVGDFLSFTYGASDSIALHQVMETVVADGSGITPEFEVRPHIRPGHDESPDITVTLKNPKGLFSLEPNSVQSRKHSSLQRIVSFNSIQIIE